MKKVFVLIVVIASFGAYTTAQNQFGIAVGPWGLNYSVTQGAVVNNTSSSIGVDYRRNGIWNVDEWKIGIGGIISFGLGKNISNWSNEDNITYMESSDQLRCSFEGFNEEQRISIWGFTVMAHAIMPNEKFSMGIGPSFNIARGEWSTAGQVTTSLYDDASGVWLGDDIVGHGLESSSVNWSDKLDLKTQLSLALEAGWYPYDNFYIGVYGLIPISSLTSGTDRPVIERSDNAQNQEMIYNGLFSSDCLDGSVEMWSIGLKLGLRINKKEEKSQPVPSASVNETIRQENTRLKKQIIVLQDSVSELSKIIASEPLDPSKFESVLFRFGQMCTMIPYNKRICSMYKSHYEQYKNKFIDEDFLEDCNRYYEIILQYERIQQDFNDLVNSFADRYGKARRTDRKKMLPTFQTELNDYKNNLTGKFNIKEDEVNILSYIFRKIKQLNNKFDYYIKNNTYLESEDFTIMMNDILENSDIYNVLQQQ